MKNNMRRAARGNVDTSGHVEVPSPPRIEPATPRAGRVRLGLITVTVVLVTGILSAPALAQSRRLQPQFRRGNSTFFALSTIDTLAADDFSEATLVAFLSDRNGNPLDHEVVRFTLRDGVGTLNTPSLGSDVAQGRLFGEFGSDRNFRNNSDFRNDGFQDNGFQDNGFQDNGFQNNSRFQNNSSFQGNSSFQDSRFRDNSFQDNNVMVDGVSVGNGIYVARFRAGTVPGRVSIAASWVNSSGNRAPVANITINVISADNLSVRVDDDTLLADGRDEATIIAYVTDNLDRPVRNAHVTFRLAQGSGRLVSRGGSNGRYVATYRAGISSGRAVVEVALPTINRSLRKQLTIDTVEAVELTARAFPTDVARRGIEDRSSASTTSTILVSVRDGDGKLVRNLSERDVVAQVVRGSGRVSQAQEIRLASGRGSGVYAFTFTASEVAGTSTIRVSNLASPDRLSDEVTIRTVTQVRTGIARRLTIHGYADQPFYGDGQDEALIVLTVADSRGNPVGGLDPDFLLSRGQGHFDSGVTELANQDTLGGNHGSGVYITTFTAGVASSRSSSGVRAVVPNFDGTVITREIAIATAPLGLPEVVVFPPRIPADRFSQAVIDIFDFDAKLLDTSGASRYLVDIVSGSGRIIQQPTDDGSDPDLIAGDNIHSALYEAEETASDQQIQLTVVDTAAAGYPTSRQQLRLGVASTIDAIAFPINIDRGDAVQVIALVQNEFGRPALGHELLLTVVSGRGQLLAGGQMFDDGAAVAGFGDAFANDGLYVGALQTDAVTGSDIVLRVTDTTTSSQPSVDLRVRVR